MKKLLRKIWKAIESIFNKIEDEIKELIPVAIQIVQAIKNVTDGPVDDIVAAIISQVIPGNADDILIARIRGTVEQWLPKFLLELQMIDGIANIEDPNEKLRIIIEKIKLSSDDTRDLIYHGLACKILEKLADGKLDFPDTVAIVQYYYSNVLKKK